MSFTPAELELFAAHARGDWYPRNHPYSCRCGYCEFRKRQSRMSGTLTRYKPSGWKAKTREEQRAAFQARQAARFAMGRTLSFPKTMSVGGRSSIIRYQQSRSGGEIKALDTVAPTANATASAIWALNTTGSINVLNNMTIGSSMWNRVGRKVTLKSINAQGWFTSTNNNATPSECFVRIMIIYDKQPNGALPAISDVLQDQTNGAGDQHQSTVYSGLNLNNRDRFEVICDRRFFLAGFNATTGASGGITATADEMHFEIFHKLGNRETHYKADSAPGVIGDISTGSLFCLTLGGLAAGSENMAAAMNLRLRYSDL